VFPSYSKKGTIKAYGTFQHQACIIGFLEAGENRIEDMIGRQESSPYFKGSKTHRYKQ
jgi:hypothetical protein